jgi:hypothetical protein
MRRAVLSAVAAGCTAAALLVTGIAAAAVSATYSVTGMGAANNPIETRIVGNGTGSSGDRLQWTADIEHTALAQGPPATITGGTLDIASRGGGQGRLGGELTGGTITYNAARSSRATCGDVVYDVVGDLRFDGYTGTLTVSLTQTRIRILNRCLALVATVTGSPGLTLTPATAPPAGTPPPTTDPPATTPPPGEF